MQYRTAVFFKIGQLAERRNLKFCPSWTGVLSRAEYPNGSQIRLCRYLYYHVAIVSEAYRINIGNAYPEVLLEPAPGRQTFEEVVVRQQIELILKVRL